MFNSNPKMSPSVSKMLKATGHETNKPQIRYGQGKKNDGHIEFFYRPNSPDMLIKSQE